MRRIATSLVVLLAAGALLAGGSVALAGDGPTAQNRCDALVAKLAEKRGVSVDQLKAELRARALARIDAAQKAGRITAEQAAKLRAAVESRQLCQNGRPGKALHGVRSMLAAAADYLGLSRDQLRAELKSGKSLKQLALAEGETVAGLKAAMLTPAKAKLDQAVANGRITAARRETALQKLGQLADRLIEKTFGVRPQA